MKDDDLHDYIMNTPISTTGGEVTPAIISRLVNTCERLNGRIIRLEARIEAIDQARAQAGLAKFKQI